jgi:hypothetical protein
VKVTHFIRGYDKQTEELCFQHKVPERHLRKLRELLKAESDPDLVGVYELDTAKLYQVAEVLAVPIAVDACDYFLDASADWETAASSARR